MGNFSAEAYMFCPKCGCENDDKNLNCSKCGQVLKSVSPKQDDPIAAIIPFKNSKALIAYYLGVFSIIPCVGSPLGIAALLLGLQGLKDYKKNPQSHGAVHAWVGILVGGFFGLLYTLI